MVRCWRPPVFALFLLGRGRLICDHEHVRAVADYEAFSWEQTGALGTYVPGLAMVMWSMAMLLLMHVAFGEIAWSLI